MKWTIPFVIFFLVCGVVTSQVNLFTRIDSTLAPLFKSCQFEELLLKCDSLEDIRFLDNDASIGSLAFWKARAYTEMNEPRKMAEEIERGISIFQKLGPAYNDMIRKGMMHKARTIFLENGLDATISWIEKVRAIEPASKKSELSSIAYLGFIHAESSQLAKADSLLKKAESLASELNDSSSLLFINLKLYRASYHSYKRDMQTAINFATEARGLVLSNPNAGQILSARTLSVLAGLYGGMMDYNSSRDLYETVLNQYQCQGMSFQNIRGLANMNLAIGYKLESNYAYAISHLEKAKNIFDELNEEGSVYNLATYAKLADAYSLNGQVEKTWDVARKGLSLAKKLSLTRTHHIYDILMALGAVEPDPLTRVQYTLEAHELATDIFGPRHFGTISSAIALASSYARAGDVGNAIKYNQMVNDLMKNMGRHPTTAFIYKDLTSGSLRNQNVKDAEMYLDSAFFELNQNTQIKSRVYEASKSVPNLAFFVAEIEIEKWRKTHDPGHLVKAHEFYLQAIDAIKFILPITSFPQEKNALIHQLYEYYDVLNENLILLNEEDPEGNWSKELFKMVAESKNVVLRERLSNVQIEKVSSNRASIENKLLTLNSEILLLQRDIDTRQNENSNTEKTQRLIDAKNRFQKLQKDHEIEYGTPHSRVLSVEEFQERLNSDEVVLEYFVAGDKLYVFLVQSSSYQLISLGEYSIVNDLLERFRKAMIITNGERITQSTLEETKSMGASIYQLILKPVMKLVNDQDELKELIIIPDREIFYLPFEALTTPNEKFLLEENFTISYDLSTDFIGRVNNAGCEKKLAFFAPDYKSNVILPVDTIRSRPLAYYMNRESELNLPISDSEWNMFNKKWKADIFQKTNATKSNFYKSSDQYCILHVSAHAILEEQNPELSYLLFQDDDPEAQHDEKLFLGEIYASRFPSELAFLSACQTASGTISNGEGVISFARAFRYAGTLSTITGLWSLPNASTSSVTSSFYSYLKQGQSKSQALKNAKLDYLISQNEPILKHPYYWSGLVLQGNRNAVNIIKQMDIIVKYLPYAMVAVAIIFFIVFYKRKSIAEKQKEKGD